MKIGIILGLVAAQSDFFVLEELSKEYSTSTEEICPPNGDCYPLYFQPKPTWQPILPGQRVPKGLHIRMDYTSGKKEAKLMDPKDKTTDTSVNVIENKPEISSSDANLIRHQGPDYKRPLNQRERDSLDKIFGEKDIPTYEKVKLLTDLADRALDYDIGYAITNQKIYVEELLDMMRSDDLDLSNVAALVLGSCLGNNAGAQKNVLKVKNSLKDIFGLVVNCKNEAHCSRMAYVLAALIRYNSTAVDIFLKLNPWNELENLLKYELVRARLFRFIEDIIENVPSKKLNHSRWCDKLQSNSLIWKHLDCTELAPHNEL